MTIEEIQAKSKEKVDQVHALMKVLNLTTQVRTRLTQQGFIEDTVIWVDTEVYPEPVAEAAEIGSVAGPQGEGSGLVQDTKNV